LTGLIKNNVQAVVGDSSITTRLIELLVYPYAKVQNSALFAVCDLFTHPQASVTLICLYLQRVPVLLSHSDAFIREHASLVLSNIAAGTATQIQAIFNTTTVIPRVLDMMQTKSEVDGVCSQAAFIFLNIASGESGQQYLCRLMEQQVIAPLCDLVGCNRFDTVAVVLCTIEKMLQLGQQRQQQQQADGHLNLCVAAILQYGGLEHIKALQQHEHPGVCKKAHNIITIYFPDQAKDTSH
jgi:2C-methyl-D-erythritol 2,4-cyclodiphosphate synthase